MDYHHKFAQKLPESSLANTISTGHQKIQGIFSGVMSQFLLKFSMTF